MQTEEKDLSQKHLAHDLNNIFTRILTSVELLKHKNQSDENYSLLLNNIEAGTNLASEIIGSSLGRLKTAQSARRINVNSIIQDVVRSFQLQNNKQITFNLSLQKGLRLISAKYTDVYRIVMNLVTNAVEAIEFDGVISVASSFVEDTRTVQIEVSDNGCGIEGDVLGQIFEDKFSTKDSVNNFGVGLSIVKQLVESYNGTIAVKSEKNIGTTFTLNIPVASHAKKKTAPGKKTILIAEDESLLCGLLAELLQTLNYKVLTASNGKEVLSLLAENKCDLLIIDKKMPVMDGVECITEIREKQISIPIILASGSQVENLEMQSLLKVDYTLNKPYNFEELLSVIEELVL